MRKNTLLLLISILLFNHLNLCAEVDPELLAGMKARSIGPAGMSGRIAAIDAVRSNPDLIYVGAATGGVWKTVNGGTTWTPIFDDQPVAAIGDVTIFQKSPDTVWVGTGEGNVRNSASVGNGVYQSMDAGKTWKHLGLENTERIHRVVLHPDRQDIAYVAAMGREWGENPDRGVFKTEDGGKTWKKILYVNERTGCADLVMDPSNPNKLFAAMWDYRRWPWNFRSGGPGSGLYVTVDGGETWKKLTEEDGLPKGVLGRIGVAFSYSNPDIVYAIVEAQKSALIRSEDGGKSWKIVNEDEDIAGRPFYYADLRVDPVRPDRVYRLETQVRVSNDGGKTFEQLIPFRFVHSDNHALWIDTGDPSFMILGNDGGVAISRDRGQTWQFVGNLPLAQYYHIRIDNDKPYHVYGGLQDNGSWRGPAEVWENGGIRTHHWEDVGGGDGFDTLPDPADSMTGYSMSQQGYLVRWNLHTGERLDARPPAPEGVKLRFNWNAALAIDPHDGNTIYYGSQFVHKSTDRGASWSIISPDLTTNNPEWQKQEESGGLTPDVTGAENYTTLLVIAPSPVDPRVIWAGTDDGRLHVSRDGGQNWTSLEKNVKGVPENTWIPHIEPSRFDAAEAFVAYDDHRRSNWTPYVFKTSDFGESWKSIATSDLSGYALSIVQDPVNRDLLFVGTEFGLYVSLNGGKRWMKWKHGFPTVSAMDMAIHPQEHDLVIGTHGRSIYVLDDISPLRSMTDETMSKPAHVFAIPDAHQYQIKQTAGERSPGHTAFRGENEPYGGLITYSLKVEGLPHPDKDKHKQLKEAERQKNYSQANPDALAKAEEPGSSKPKDKEPEVDIIVTDEQGNTIRNFKGPAKLGLNRAAWDLRRDPFRELPPPPEPRFREPQGPEILPGTYTVTVQLKEHKASSTIRVSGDPRINVTPEDRKKNYETQLRLGGMQETAVAAIDRITAASSDIGVVLQKADASDRINKVKDPANSPFKDLREFSRTLKSDLARLERKFWTPYKSKGIPPRITVTDRISYSQRSVGSVYGAPTPSQLAYVKEAEDSLKAALEEHNRFFAERVAEFRSKVQDAKIHLLPEQEPLGK